MMCVAHTRHHTRSAPRALAAITLALSASNAAAQLADSFDDFSGTQGAGGWLYGYYDLATDKNDRYDADEDFTPFPDSAFNGAAWNISPGPATTITSFGATPGGTNGPAEQWAIRRWTSDRDAAVTIEGVLESIDRRGGGTIASLVVDGIAIKVQPVTNGNRFTFRCITDLRKGSTVDCIVNAAGDDNFDITRFIITITETPCPADYNADGRLDLNDLLEFLDDFYNGDGDFNGDGATTPTDVLTFYQRWIEDRLIGC